MESISLEYQSPAVELKECFSSSTLNVMNFLNEIVMEYPHAISFAPGRPPEHHFDVEKSFAAMHEYVRYAAVNAPGGQQQIWHELGQYNRTNGIINDLIAQELEIDEGIRISPSSLLVTVGAQEAMAIILAGLFDPERDVLLASDPTYIGMTGLAKILGIRVLPVPSGDDGLEAEQVERAIQACFSSGRPRALYDIPDFNNPLGTTLSLERRLALLDICRKHGMLLIEDNPYGMFRYECEKIPTIKALDKGGTVLYIGSFSKTLYPGLRLGYLIADQRVAGPEQVLAKELSKVKSLLTVNSSPVLQAIVGGILLENKGSLRAIVKPKVEAIHRNRDVMLQSLSEGFSKFSGAVSWNRPQGGFFITVTLPFSFGEEELKTCALQYGVIVCPMRYFAIANARHHQVRLSFSYVNEKQISEGIERFAAFVEDRCRMVKIRAGSSMAT